MGYIIGRNTRVEVQKTLSAAIPISAITNANPGVVTYFGTDPVNGDVVVIGPDVPDMSEISDQTVRVSLASPTSPSTFAMERLNTTLYGVFSGVSSFKIVTEWSTLGNAKTLAAGTVSPNKLDSTTLLDSIKRYLLGQSDTPEITVDMLSNPFLEAVELIVAAAEAGSQLAFRVTCMDGSKRVFGGLVTLPSENITTGEIATGGFSIVQVGKRLSYPT